MIRGEEGGMGSVPLYSCEVKHLVAFCSRGNGKLVNWTQTLPARPLYHIKYHTPDFELLSVPRLFLLWRFLLNNEKRAAGFSAGVIGSALNGPGCKLCLHQLEAP